ncbi:hypothetical protein VSH64_23545 [Amycolatopsis rhabdoformis]|uniref:LPXTG cell wall anchor domain-containing protein n=1 Tax=Amycolatopsis rhabdoformis TaxID=1448059 RepID=A0ABZ1IKF3_9PSEU|nr:hypothetical protein [Amycolatopsis rhabdoformis]WSE35009.1 hypothetical protein VSH64_23545 [Amycolatopsis rhabdoformis]
MTVLPSDTGTNGTGGGAGENVGTTVPGRTLAYTGFDLGFFVLAAAVLIGLGVVALIAVRRRRADARRTW